MPIASNLPPKAKRMWEDVYQSAKSRGYPDESAARQAWGAVKRCYRKNKFGYWERKPSGCTHHAVRGRVVRARGA
jgi:cation transport regulator ChaB